MVAMLRVPNAWMTLYTAICGVVITLRVSTNSLVNSAGFCETAMPSQLTSVQPSVGLPLTVTTEVLSSG